MCCQQKSWTPAFAGVTKEKGAPRFSATLDRPRGWHSSSVIVTAHAYPIHPVILCTRIQHTASCPRRRASRASFPVFSSWPRLPRPSTFFFSVLPVASKTKHVDARRKGGHDENKNAAALPQCVAFLHRVAGFLHRPLFSVRDCAHSLGIARCELTLCREPAGGRETGDRSPP
jgi:hypothetical protein